MTANVDHIVGKYLLATETERVYGGQWYPLAKEVAINIGQKYGVTTECAAAVIAALSPNNKWERNCKDAENLIAAYVAGGIKQAADVKVCTYGANKAKALVILDEAYPQAYDTILNGRKVVAFYHCIMGDLHHVVIDGHAYSVWVGERLTMKEVPAIGKKLYAAIVDDYIEAAGIINAMHGTGYTPAQVQAITWVCHKRIHGV